MKYRLAVAMSHPIPYKVPLWRRLARHEAIDLTVFYYSDHSTRHFMDKEFGRPIAWDDDLLSGYPHRILRNWSPHSRTLGFWGCVNPSIFAEVWRGRFDALLVYGYWFSSNWLAITSAWLSRTPVLMRSDSELLSDRSLLARGVKRLVLPLLFRGVSGFVTVGQFNEDYYRHYGVVEDRFFRAPFAVDNESIARKVAQERGRRALIRHELGLPVDRPVILFLGKLAPRKRPLDLLEAFAETAPHGEASLLFVGEGAERSALEKRAAELGLLQVVLAGFRNSSEIPSMLAACDLMVLPSEKDPKSLAVNEAMAAGLPVVISDRVGHYAPGDLVQPGLTGEVFPVGDRKALALCLSRLVRDPERLSVMGRAAAEAVASVNFEATVEGMLSALRAVARRAALAGAPAAGQGGGT